MTASSSLGFFCVRWRANGQTQSVFTRNFVNAMNVYLKAKTKHIQLIYFPAFGSQVSSIRR